MAITPGQQINPAFGRVDYSPKLQAQLATGPTRVQASLAASARKIDKANKFMAEYKQKQETKALNDQAVAYIQRLGQQNDPATQQVMQSLSVNPEDTKEVNQFVKVMGGATEATKTLMEAIKETQELFRAAGEQQQIASSISGVYGGGSTQVIPGASAKGAAVNTLLESGMAPEDIKEYLSLLDFEEGTPPDVGAEVAEDLKNLRAEAEAGSPYVVNYETGKVQYKGAGFGKKEIKPGDVEYEQLRRRYPDLVAELDKRRAFRAQEGTQDPIKQPEYSASDLEEALRKYD